MTTLLRPRHGTSGQVAARQDPLDCCALEHRLLFSAAPLDLTLSESSRSVEVSLDRVAQEHHAEQLPPAHVIHSEQIPTELATLDALIQSLNDWHVNDGTMHMPFVISDVVANHDSLESITDLFRGSHHPPIKISLSHSSLSEDDDPTADLDTGLLTTLDAEPGEALVDGQVGGEHFDLALDLHSLENDVFIRGDTFVEDRATPRIEPSPGTDPHTIDTALAGRYRPSAPELLDQLNARALDHQLDLMIDAISGKRMPDSAVAGATLTTAAMSIGYMMWTTHASYMMATLVAATPVWKQMDPLPILEFTEVDELTTDGDDRSEIDRLLQDPHSS